MASAVSDWAQIAVTAILGVITAFVGLSVRLKARQEIATTVSEKRFDAYAALWARTAVASPMRVVTNEPPLTAEQLRELYDSLTCWYYGAGHGMLLSKSTRDIYLTAKKNLVCDVDEFVPASTRAKVREHPAGRSDAAVRQLSMLRTAMRGDLEVYAGPWGHDLDDEDREFLRACAVDPDRAPWTVSRRRGARRLRA